MMDRLGYISGHVERYLVGYAFRETFGYDLHLLFYCIGHFHGVGAGEHVDVEHSGIASVDSALGGVA